ncbi:hypothetical protein VTI74DRAFT_7779 [Chaetomium olivicolor]
MRCVLLQPISSLIPLPPQPTATIYQKVLDALAASGVSIEWPPAAARQKMIILVSILVPLAVIILSIAGCCYWLHCKDDCAWESCYRASQS